MIVSEIMQKKVIFVTPQDTVHEAAKIIFGKKHNGLPVVSEKSKKLVGFLTDQDILSQCFPSIKEYMEDSVHGRDFTAMEKKLKSIMQMKVGDVMNKQVVYVTKDMPLLKAESLMKVKDIARLPVVNDKNELIGLLTKRDIFRVLVGKYF